MTDNITTDTFAEDFRKNKLPLLITDLVRRLPFGVKFAVITPKEHAEEILTDGNKYAYVKAAQGIHTLRGIRVGEDGHMTAIDEQCQYFPIERVRPYLFNWTNAENDGALFPQLDLTYLRDKLKNIAFISEDYHINRIEWMGYAKIIPSTEIVPYLCHTDTKLHLCDEGLAIDCRNLNIY